MAGAGALTLFWSMFAVILLMCIPVKAYQVAPVHETHHADCTMDEALLHVHITVEKPDSSVEFLLEYKSDVCYECKYQPVLNSSTGGVFYFHQNSNVDLKVDTQHPVALMVFAAWPNGTILELCRVDSFSFKECGNYSLYIMKDLPGNSTCNLTPDSEVWDSNIPIYVAIGVFVALALLWIFLKFLIRKGYIYKLFCMQSDHLVTTDLGIITIVNEEQPENNKSKERLNSLDAFRGIAITIMIFVNYGGGKYWFFRHSRWNGLTVADLVFPWFVFIMGTAMAFSFRGVKKRKVSKLDILKKIVFRTVVLFILGIIINTKDSVTEPDKLRIPGVLQRFAATYLVLAVMEMFFAHPDPADMEASQGLLQDDMRLINGSLGSNSLASIDAPHPPQQTNWWHPIRDIVLYWAEWIIGLSCAIVHVAVTFAVQVPDCDIGNIGPGGPLYYNGSHANCTGGVAGYIDRWILGRDRIYQSPSFRFVYSTTLPYDPEGILGTLTSIFICFLGLHAGKIMITYRKNSSKILRLMLFAVLTGGLALLLTKCSQNEGWVPINKNLWSLSFVLATGSMAYLLLIVCYLLIDVKQFWSGAPFIYPGKNSILVYVCHEMFSNCFPVQFKVPSTHGALLAVHLWGAAFWVLVSYYLYVKKFFLAL